MVAQLAVAEIELTGLLSFAESSALKNSGQNRLSKLGQPQVIQDTAWWIFLLDTTQNTAALAGAREGFIITQYEVILVTLLAKAEYCYTV